MGNSCNIKPPFNCPSVADVISDTILIVAPLQLLWQLDDKGLRRRLCAIFSSCIITTIVSLVHAALILTGGGPKVLIAAVVEVCLPYLRIPRFLFGLGLRILDRLQYPHRSHRRHSSIPKW